VSSKIWEFKLSDVKMFLNYRYMFKHIAIEIWFFNKKRSFLLVFEDKGIRDNIYKFFSENCEKVSKEGISKEDVILMWQEGEISNFDYLMYLNTISNRSFCDLS